MLLPGLHGRQHHAHRTDGTGAAQTRGLRQPGGGIPVVEILTAAGSLEEDLLQGAQQNGKTGIRIGVPLQRQLHGGGQAQLGIQRQLVAVGVQQVLELREGKIVLPAAAPQAGKVYVVDSGGLILQGGSTGTDAVDYGGIGAVEQEIPVGEQRRGPHDEGRIAACFAVLLDQQHGGLDLGQRVLLVLAVRAGKDVGEALGVHQKLVAVLGGSGRLAGAVLAVQLQHLAHHLHQLPGLNAGKAVQAVDVLEVVGHVLVHGTAVDLRVTGGAADLLRVIT